MKKQHEILLIIAVAVLGIAITALIIKELFKMKKFVYQSGSGVQQRYFEWITPHAKIVGDKNGIPWQAIVVQTALETGYGKSSLLTKYNNFGGIKSVKGDASVSLGTTEFINGQYVTITDGFAVYKSPKDGLEAYGMFFSKYPRYKEALKHPNDPYKFIIEIKKAGYATDPNYVSKLHGMLNQYFSK